MRLPFLGRRSLPRSLAALAASTVAATALAACGARSQLIIAPFDVPPAPDGFAMDARDAAADVVDVRDVPDGVDACVPVDDRCSATEFCNNGSDDDCDGRVDEDCTCMPGDVQPCFNGPPGRRGVGACRDGTQTCSMTATWGVCQGGIDPREDVCNGQDNLCNGCSQQMDCPIQCPGPGDPRVPDAAPFDRYILRGGDFYAGVVRQWQWSVQGGPCDALSAQPSFELTDAFNQNAVFRPRLSGDYTVTLRIVTSASRDLTCTWVVHVQGPGLRIEMCYPESSRSDLDLFLHRPDDMTPWYPIGGTASDALLEACSWSNCEATIRGTDAAGNFVPRANWGYENSPLRECENGPQGAEWRALGFCANPRLDIDNNLSMASGLPENINVDRPRDNQTFRIMVQNWTGTIAHPLVNVYCSGRRVATYGGTMPPDEVPRFRGTAGNQGVGAMWRVADVTTHVDAAGVTTCTSQLLHRPGATSGYYVTNDDPSY